MRIAYQWAVKLFVVAVRVMAVWNPKARKTLEGRKNQVVPNCANGSLWIHCASHGEFEMILPVIKRIKKHSHPPLVVTFFSPSGWMHGGAKKWADHVLYMPFDQPQKMQFFVDTIRPVLAVFVKAEFWYTTMVLLQKRHIPYIFASSTFYKKQYFFKKPFSWFSQQLKAAEAIFVQDQNSLQTLMTHGFKNAQFSGNTRMDRVLQIKNEPYLNERIQRFKGNRDMLVIGSSWRAEEELLTGILDGFDDLAFVLAPHDVSPQRIKSILEVFGERAVLLSDEVKEVDKAHVLVVDRIGILSKIYRYATIAWVGGGFRKKGLHNTLEPAAYYIPVIVGPYYRDFPESAQLVESGLMKPIHDENSLATAIQHFRQTEVREKVKMYLMEYFDRNRGASEKISTFIIEMIRRKEDNHGSI